MAGTIFRFRRLKWGDPAEKLKVLADSIRAGTASRVDDLIGSLSSVGIALLAGAMGFAGVYALLQEQPLAASPFKLLTGQCAIKGNISIGDGERIYHLPGQQYYSATRIDTSRGERWFCTEQQARAAGWRKSRV